MSAADTVARMLALVPWLLERPGASVAETAAAFGVDTETVLSDLDTIGYCGLPGLGGGDLFEISIVGGRILVELVHGVDRPLRLNPREALRLVIAGEAVAAALGRELPALRSAVDAVRDAAGIPPGVTVQLDEDGLHWLEPLREAIDDALRVRLEYRGRGDAVPTTRTVDPWTLHLAEGSWYVEGHEHEAEDVRTFRLDRIADLEVTGDPAAPRPPDVAPRPPRYEPDPGHAEVELVLDRSARWVADEVSADTIEDLEGGRRRIVFRTDALPWIQRLVLGAAGGVTVVRPRELAASVREAAATALERYA